MKSKAAVAKALKDKGIPIPAEDSYSAMVHRLNTWGEGKGYLFRRIKTRFYGQQNLPADIPFGAAVWIPDSDFARRLAKTGAMFPLGRAFYSETYTLIDVPQTEEYAEPKSEPKKKKPAPKKKASKKVSKSGNNNSADS